MLNKYSTTFNPIQGERLWSQVKKENTVYREFEPSKELQEYVACYWFSKTYTLENKPLISRIIPDGCMDIIFNINEISKGKGAEVCGTMTTPDIKEVKGIREYIGIRFLPGGIIPFIKQSATNFTDQLIALEDIWSKEDIFIKEKLYLTNSIENRIEIIEELLKAKLSNTNDIPDLIKNALYIINLNRGRIPTKELAQSTYTSQRNLSRKFNEYIGVSPKKFSSIVRFQHIINILDKNSSIDFSDLAQDHGYFDQAHFIKDFKTFYGKTPKATISKIEKSIFYNTYTF